MTLHLRLVRLLESGPPSIVLERRAEGWCGLSVRAEGPAFVRVQGVDDPIIVTPGQILEVSLDDVPPAVDADLLDAAIRRALTELKRLRLKAAYGGVSPEDIDARLAAVRKTEQPGATSHPGIDAERTQPAKEPGSGRSAGADKGSTPPVIPAMASATSPVCPGRSTTDPAPVLSDALRHLDALVRVARARNIKEGLHATNALADVRDALQRARVLPEDHASSVSLERARSFLRLARARVRDAQRNTPALPRTCTWAQGPDGVWEGLCGVRWSSPDGTPTKSGMSYCLRCGSKLTEWAEPKTVDVFEAFSRDQWSYVRTDHYAMLERAARAWFGPFVAALERAAEEEECENPPSLDNWTCSGCWPCEAKKIVSTLRQRVQEARRG